MGMSGEDIDEVGDCVCLQLFDTFPAFEESFSEPLLCLCISCRLELVFEDGPASPLLFVAEAHSKQYNQRSWFSIFYCLLLQFWSRIFQIMGACETCSREAEYNAVDSDDLMQKLESTEIGLDISKLRVENRESIANYSFTPMTDKSFYKGKLSGTKREGYGENYAGCFNYFGNYKNDLPHGQGAIITDNQCLVGNFQAGVLQGPGKDWSNGVIFQGTYRDGERVEGRLSTQQASYHGHFLKDLFHGKGTLTQKKGFTYEGQFKAGKFDGQGKASFEGGSSFKGGFKDGLYHGFGEFHWHNGNFYRGEYSEGKRHGFGVLRIGGIEYSGTWNKGVREGHGILTHESELTFGNYHNNILIEQ